MTPLTVVGNAVAPPEKAAGLVPGGPFKGFPPQWNHIRIPTSSRADARSGVAMYTPGAWKGIWAQRAAWVAVAAGGPGVLPGRAESWEPPMPPELWPDLLAAWRGVVGTVTAMAIHERRGPRSGFAALLLRSGEPIGFVKTRSGASRLIANEVAATTAARDSSPATFRTVSVLAHDRIDAWDYVVTSALPRGLHHAPPDPPLGRIAAEVREALSFLERPPEVPGHWVPAHGDFAPWNLRAFRGSGTYLIDWEEAGWAPPGADEAYYRAAAATLRPTRADRVEPGEGAAYWHTKLVEKNKWKESEGLEVSALDLGIIAVLEPAARPSEGV